MRRWLLGTGIALLGAFCVLGWQLSGSSVVGWLGAVGLVAGGLLMLSPLFDASTVQIDEDGEIVVDGVEYTIR